MKDSDELQKRYERLEALFQVSNLIHSTLDPQEALQIILREAVRLTGASGGSVVLVNPTTGFLEIEASIGLPENAPGLRLRVGEGITGWVARSGETARVGDVHGDPRYIMLRSDVRSELAVPLLVAGELRGVVNVDSREANAFTEEDQQLLEALALQAARAIHNTWLFEQARLKAHLLESLVSVGRAINSTLNLDDTLNVVAREACNLMNAKVCSLLMLDESAEWLDLRANFGAGESYIRKPRLNVAESLVGIVIRRRKPIQVENVQVSGRYQNVDVARQEGLVSLLTVPLLFGEEPFGALNVYTAETHSFSNEEIRILSGLAELSAVAIHKARLYERIVNAEDQLRQSERLSALGLLAAEVAHEIRNPLTVMKMMFHSLDLRFAPEDPREKDARIMAEKMDHLNGIVDQILDFARNAEPKPECIDVNRILDDLVLLARHKFQQQGIRLERRFASALPRFMADARQLEQAFLNLILNAVEAMPNGGELVLTTKAVSPPTGRPSPARIAVEFKDTGEGMTAEQRRRAFGSLLSTTKAKGTGLGLAIVRRVVEAHQGEIKIRSQPKRGTTISLLFPLRCPG